MSFHSEIGLGNWVRSRLGKACRQQPYRHGRSSHVQFESAGWLYKQFS